jgi:outer membrane usher protein
MFARGLAGLARGALAALALSTPTFAATEAEDVGEIEYAKPVSSRLNRGSRAIDMPVPLKDDGTFLGEVAIRINPDDSILVNKTVLSAKLGAAIDGAVHARLDALTAENGFVSLAALNAVGLNLHFDPGLQELQLRAAVEQRPVGELSFGDPYRTRISTNLARPALMAGYLNVTAGVDYRWPNGTLDPAGKDGATSAHLDLESVIRAWNIVIENQSRYTGDGYFLGCAPSPYCSDDTVTGFTRQTTRLTYDMPESEIRFQAGDLEPIGMSMQHASDMLGLSLQKSAQKLNPGENIRPTGKGSFRIDYRAQVDIVVNGMVMQRLDLRPGNYDIRDLPLTTGSNDIVLVITDETGNVRRLDFSTYFDSNMLAAGKSEWALAAGVPSYYVNDEREYADQQYMATGWYRYGVSDDLTADANLQADGYGAMAGLGTIRRTPWGAFAFETAISSSTLGVGGGIDFDWSLVNFDGFAGRPGESVHVGAEFHTRQFYVPGRFLDTPDGVLKPAPDYGVRLDASYTLPLAWETTATLAGRYRTAYDEEADGLIYYTHGDRYGADLTFSRPLSRLASASLTLGFSNESYLDALFLSDTETDPAFRAALRFNVRPDDRTSVSMGYDTLNEHVDISAYRTSGNGLGRWDTNVFVQYADFQDTATVNASAGYYGNRAEVRVLQSSGIAGVLDGRFDTASVDQRTSLQVSSSFAFADGHFAVGAPVRGDAFAIVYPHESIAGKEIMIGSNDDLRAVADGWGPAVVSSIPAYSQSTIPVDVADLPLGYSLGAAAFDTYAPYRGGYALQVGSANSVSAYGTLLLSDGEPVALLTGVAHPENDPNAAVTIFTNAAGKFGAEGLAPGRWIIEMATDDKPTRYVIDVPDGTDGLFKAGTLHPSG